MIIIPFFYLPAIPMTTLNITFVAPHSLEAELTDFLRDAIPDLSRSAGGAEAMLMKVLPQADDLRLAVQLRFDSMQTLTDWQDSGLEPWLRPVFERFGNKVLPFPSVLQHIDL